MSSPLKINRQKWYNRLGYVPRRGQKALDDAADAGCRYLALFAYPRAGKSFGAARHVEPYLLLPDHHIWIVAPTYELGSKEFGYIWNDLLELGFLQQAASRHYDKRGGNMAIEFPWGSFVRVISADNPAALRAEELDHLILAEASALSQDIFYNHLFARVEKRKGAVLIPTTPKGYNWIYETFRIPSLAPGHKDLRGRDNPRHDPLFWSAIVSAVPEYGDILEPDIYAEDTIERARRTMPLPFFKEQFGGDFSSYAGLIYPWDPRTMLVEPFTIPADWTHVIGWDHGARDENPTAILLGSYAPTGELFWWGEIYKGNRSIKEYWHECQTHLSGKSPQFISSDPSAKQVRIELQSLGVTSIFPYDKDINARIVRITQLMREGKMKVLRGCCPNLVKEIQSWEWDEKQLGKPRAGQACHALDAIGYAVLIPVFAEQTTLDPLAPAGEDQKTQTLWRGLRKKFMDLEEEQQRREDDSTILASPFDEILTVEDYDFSSHQGVV